MSSGCGRNIYLYCFADDSNLHTSTPVKRGKYDDGSVIAQLVESPVAGMAGDNR